MLARCLQAITEHAVSLDARAVNVHADDHVEAAAKYFVDLPRVGGARLVAIDVLWCTLVLLLELPCYVLDAVGVVLRSCRAGQR